MIRGLLADVPWDAPVGTLSGGQRRRVELAGLLTGEWDVLLLDEPTNHLDVEAITWLAGHLKRRWAANAGGLVVVTHDRWFLDEVCNATWEVHDRIVEPFEGGYAAYILQRVERDRMAASSEAKRQNLARKELAWLRRGAPARTSKPKFRIDAANALIADVPEIRDKVSLQSLAVARLGKDVVDLLDASVDYDGNQVLNDVEWRIAPGERTGILGVNGAGKSTLLGLIAGTVRPSTGTVRRGKTVRIATLAQRIGELEDHLDEPVAGAPRRPAHQLHPRHRVKDPGADARPAARAARLLHRAAVDPGPGPVRRAAAPPAAAADPARPAERAHPRRADQRPRHRHAGGDRGPARLLAGDADRGLARPLLPRARHRSAVRDPPPPAAASARRRRRVPPAAGGGIGGGHLPTPAPSGAPPGGQAASAGTAAANGTTPARAETAPALSGAALRDAQKEVAAVERRMAKLTGQINDAKNALATHDHSDYQGLTKRMKEIAALEADVEALEERWFELTEALG